MAEALLTHDVDAAEAVHGLGHGAGHVLVVADVPHQGQRTARRASVSSCAAVNTVPASLGWGSPVLAIRTMLAPSAAARRAMARPMPRLPPDIRMVFPRSEPEAR